MPKYVKRTKALNNDELYEEMFEDRNITGGITQYKTKLIGQDFKNIKTETIRHVWSMGDRFFKLSHKHYGTYDFWWVIALFNSVPTEAHLNYGDVIYIPVRPLQLVAEV
tara:strand:- start:10116 stop:10442 length:327 start_codon:yes stop_codon:yes gene_type:complete